MVLENIRANGIQGTIEELANSRAGALGQRQAEEAPGSESGDREPITEADFDEWRENALVAGDWQTVAILVVEPQVGRVWGFGDVGSPEYDGRFWGDLQSSVPENVDNVLFRVAWQNARGKGRDSGKVFHSKVIRQATDDRRTWEHFPEVDMPMIKENSELRLEAKFLGSSGSEPTLDQSETGLIIDTTIFDES